MSTEWHLNFSNSLQCKLIWTQKASLALVVFVRAPQGKEATHGLGVSSHGGGGTSA